MLLSGFSGILFDMDGVLVDSEPVVIKAIIQVIEENYNIKLEKKDFDGLYGTGEDSFIGGAVRKHGGKYTLEMKDLSYARYKELSSEIKPYKDIDKLFKKLKDKGFKIAICSSADKIKVDTNIKICNVKKYVDYVTDASTIKNKKPDPEIYIKGAKAIGVSPDKCIVVEDAVSGILSGKSAGCFTIGVTNTYTKKELQEAGADLIIKNTSDIIDLI